MDDKLYISSFIGVTDDKQQLKKQMSQSGLSTCDSRTETEKTDQKRTKVIIRKAAFTVFLAYLEDLYDSWSMSVPSLFFSHSSTHQYGVSYSLYLFLYIYLFIIVMGGVHSLLLPPLTA